MTIALQVPWYIILNTAVRPPHHALFLLRFYTHKMPGILQRSFLLPRVSLPRRWAATGLAPSAPTRASPPVTPLSTSGSRSRSRRTCGRIRPMRTFWDSRRILSISNAECSAQPNRLCVYLCGAGMCEREWAEERAYICTYAILLQVGFCMRRGSQSMVLTDVSLTLIQLPLQRTSA